ncbi:MAG: PEP-CTERM sorting domain-containing protein [bacterium]|nr:PEP-CTERM sorting domain-containing protein [bacterium]
MQRTAKLGLTIGLMTLSAALMAQTTVKVYSLNPAPGDLFTNSGTANQGSSFGHSNWVYNNTRGGGQVGIRNNYPRSGNGSVYFNSPSSTAKADIEYFVDPVNVGGNFVPNPYNPNSIMGTLNQLTHLSYDWYRDGISTTINYLHPVLRLGILRVNSDNSVASGYLVFERIYNGFGTAPTGSWQTDDIISNNYKLWATASLGFGDPNANINAVLKTIPEWIGAANDANATLYLVSVNAGFGSGWSGSFTGAVDNITFGFNGQYTTYNFEVVPEPASLLALGSGFVSLLALRRRRK